MPYVTFGRNKDIVVIVLKEICIVASFQVLIGHHMPVTRIWLISIVTMATMLCLDYATVAARNPRAEIGV